jgi:hypothetical protein
MGACSRGKSQPTSSVDFAHLARLFESGVGSDFIVQCKTKQWKVHKFVLEQSSFFRAAAEGSFKVSNASGALTPACLIDLVRKRRMR